MSAAAPDPAQRRRREGGACAREYVGRGVCRAARLEILHWDCGERRGFCFREARRECRCTTGQRRGRPGPSVAVRRRGGARMRADERNGRGVGRYGVPPGWCLAHFSRSYHSPSMAMESPGFCRGPTLAACVLHMMLATARCGAARTHAVRAADVSACRRRGKVHCKHFRSRRCCQGRSCGKTHSGGLRHGYLPVFRPSAAPHAPAIATPVPPRAHSRPPVPSPFARVKCVIHCRVLKTGKTTHLSTLQCNLPKRFNFRVGIDFLQLLAEARTQ